MSNEKGRNDLRDNRATFRGGGRMGCAARNGFPKLPDKDKRALEVNAKEIIRNFTHYGGQSQVLSAMSREQRKVLHEIAQRHGISTKSHGKEPNRFVVISIRDQQLGRAKPITAPIEPAGELLTKVSEYMAEHPITREDVEQFLDEQPTWLYQQKTPVVKNRAAVPPKTQCIPRLRKIKDALPATHYREQTLGAISKCAVVIISGGTGCGKTTQVPQFILENAAAKQQRVRILVTQPRRIAAISIAERVAKERGELIGDTVGYQVRLESKKSDRTLLTYCTTGVLLRMLTSDPMATGITHIVMDEIHEREINTDYLLIALRECLEKRKDLKIILMSATIEGSMALFCTYFERFTMETIKIESKLFHVEIFHLDQILAMSGYEPPKDRSFFAPFHFEPEQWANEIEEIKKEQEQQKYYEQAPLPPIQIPVPMPVQEFDYSYDSVGNANGEWVSGACPTMNGQIIDGATMEQFMVAMGEPPIRPMLLQLRPGSPKSVYLEGVRYQLDETQPAETLAGHALRRASMPVVELNLDAPMSPALQTPSSAQSGLGRFNNDGFGFGEKHAYAELIEKKFRVEMKSVLPNRTIYYHPTVDEQVAATDFKKLRLAEKYEMFYGADYVTSINHHLVDVVVKYLADSPKFGSILVFLPGYDDIQEMIYRIGLWQNSLTNMKKVIVIPLHSQMHSVDHSDIFRPVPQDTRKIILSTNIAEASITIEDVVFVVDTGRAKEKSYNHETKLSALTVSPISKSNAKQRSGRAGRVTNGYCFRLYSEKEYATMADTQLAEMKRAAIYDVTLHAKIFAPKGMRIAQFLALAPEPPSPEAIQQSMEFLEQIGALYSRKKFTELVHQKTDEDPEITDLGRLMARLPLDPNLSRMMLFGLALKCLGPIVNLVAMLANRDPFILTMDKAREDQNRMKAKFAQNDFSDHMMLIRICNEFCGKPHSEQHKFCRDNFLNMSTMRMVNGTRRKLLQELIRAKLIWIRPERDVLTVLNDRVHNKHAESWPMVQAAIAAGSYPAVGVCPSDSKLKKIQTYNACPSGIHPSSIVKKQIRPSKSPSEPQLEYVAFQELCQTPDSGTLLMKMVTAFPSITALLFTGPIRMSQLIVDEHYIVNDDGEPTDTVEEIEESVPRFDDVVFEVDSWYTVSARKKTLRDLLRLRHKFMHFFLKSICHPTRFGVDTSRAENQLLTLIRELLEAEHQRYNFTHVEMPRVYLKNYEPRPAPRMSPRFEEAPRVAEPVLNRSVQVQSSAPSNVQNHNHSLNGNRNSGVSIQKQANLNQNLNHQTQNQKQSQNQTQGQNQSHQNHQNLNQSLHSHRNHFVPNHHQNQNTSHQNPNPQNTWPQNYMRMPPYPTNYPPPSYFNPPHHPPLYNVAQPPPTAPRWTPVVPHPHMHQSSAPPPLPVNYPMPARSTAGCSLRGGANGAHYRNTGDRGHAHSYGPHH